MILQNRKEHQTTKKRSLFSFKTRLPVLSAAGIGMLFSMFLLSGCANLFHSAADNVSSKERCQTSDRLYTDLTAAEDQRTYVLPNGQTCPKEVL